MNGDEILNVDDIEDGYVQDMIYRVRMQSTFVYRHVNECHLHHMNVDNTQHHLQERWGAGVETHFQEI